jgi:hypothetical protein
MVVEILQWHLQLDIECAGVTRMSLVNLDGQAMKVCDSCMICVDVAVNKVMFQ